MAAFNPNLADDQNREDDVTRWRTGVGQNLTVTVLKYPPLS